MPDRGWPLALKADFGGQPDLFPLALSAVHEQEVLDGVVGHEQIDEPVAVDVGRDDAKRLAERPLDVGALADFGERAVAVVVEEQARVGLKTRGMQ